MGLRQTLPLLLCLLFFSSKPSQATSVSNTQVSLEVFGAGILYQVYGSYRPWLPVAINLGASYAEIQETTVYQVPASVSLLSGVVHSAELLLGLNSTYRLRSVRPLPQATLFIPQGGLGYRYWPESGGFHFRFLIYAHYTQNTFWPWAGMSAGWAI